MIDWKVRRIGSLLGTACFLLGFPAGSAMAEPISLVIIGDSSSSGYGLAPQDGLAYRLDLWLRENGSPPVVIQDYAASGLTTTAALAILQRELDASVDAMIVQLGSADNSLSIEGGETRANLRSILALAQQYEISVVLIGDYSTVHQTAAYRKEFDTLFPQVAAEAGVLLYPSFYHALGGRISDVPSEYLLWDHAHPTAEALQIIADDIGPTVLKVIEETNTAKIED